MRKSLQFQNQLNYEMELDPGGFATVAYLTSDNQPMPGFGAQMRPFLRIALPVWKMPTEAHAAKETENSVTRDEIASIFGTDLVTRRTFDLRLTANERTQLETSRRLRIALRSF